MSEPDYQVSEIAYIEQLMEDLALKGDNTIDDLIQGLENEDAEDE